MTQTKQPKTGRPLTPGILLASESIAICTKCKPTPAGTVALCTFHAAAPEMYELLMGVLEAADSNAFICDTFELDQLVSQARRIKAKIDGEVTP